MFEPESDATRPLTEDELDRVVFQVAEIKLSGESGEVVAHKAPRGSDFTVRDLLSAVEETERTTRSSTNWLGGVDVHHCFFEGIHEAKNNTWEIYWGS